LYLYRTKRRNRKGDIIYCNNPIKVPTRSHKTFSNHLLDQEGTAGKRATPLGKSLKGHRTGRGWKKQETQVLKGPKWRSLRSANISSPVGVLRQRHVKREGKLIE